MGTRLPVAQHRIVLLGGGYVTLHAYAGLMRRAGRAVRRGEVQVVVISTDDAHSFHGFTGEVLAGLLPYERTRTPLAEAMPHAHVVLGRATSVDAERRVVRYELLDEQSGLRARVRPRLRRARRRHGWPRAGRPTVPGLAEHGFTLRAPGDIAVLDRARPSGRRTARAAPAHGARRRWRHGRCRDGGSGGRPRGCARPCRARALR